MKTLILSIALFLTSILTFGLDVTYSFNCLLNGKIEHFETTNEKEFINILAAAKLQLKADLDNKMILEDSYIVADAYLNNEILKLESSAKETIKTAKRVNPAPKPIKAVKQSKKALNIPLQQLAQSKDLNEVLYTVTYGSLKYETTNQNEFIINLQDVLEYLENDFKEQRISQTDFKAAYNIFTTELNKYNLL